MPRSEFASKNLLFGLLRAKAALMKGRLLTTFYHRLFAANYSMVVGWRAGWLASLLLSYHYAARFGFA